MKYSTLLFFIPFLLLPCSTELIFVPQCDSPQTLIDNATKPPIHVAAIVESDTGTLGIKNHAFLFHQLHCALKEQHSKVRIDGWKVDGGHGTCVNVETNNATENIVQASAFASPPEHSRTLCEILEFASKCATNYKGTDKLHIVTGLLLHDEIGNCTIEEMLPYVNFHLTVFWVHGHRKPPSVHSKIVDYAILESLTDISPKDGWIMPDVSMEQLYEAQQVAGQSNPILDSLYLRLKRMSDAAKATTTTRKSRRLPQKLTTEILLPTITPDDQNNSSDCQNLTTTTDNNKVKKRFVDQRNGTTSKLPCVVGIMAQGLQLYEASAPSYDSSTSSTTNSSTVITTTFSSTTDITSNSISSSSTDFSNTATNDYTTKEYGNKSTVPLIETSTPWDEENASFLERFGNLFGDRDHGILYLLFIIFIALILLCGISLLVYCLWPKYYHEEVHSRKPRSKKSDKISGATVLEGPPAEGKKPGESAEKNKNLPSSNNENSSNNNNNKMDSSNANKKKKSSDVVVASAAAAVPKKSPVKSILKKSPLQQKQQKSNETKSQKSKKTKNSHQTSSPIEHSDRSQNSNVAIDIPPMMSPAGITPLPSAISYAEKTNMKFNDKKDLEAPPPELQPLNNPFAI